MPKWVEFTGDYDHRWPSGSVTEFRTGMVVNVKSEVANAAVKAKAAKVTKKPDNHTEGYHATPSRQESARRRTLSIVAEREGRAVPRGEVRTVKVGGHVPGNPLRVAAAALPDPADPKATRSEPLVERDRGQRAAPRSDEAEDAKPDDGGVADEGSSGQPNGD